MLDKWPQGPHCADCFFFLPSSDVFKVDLTTSRQLFASEAKALLLSAVIHVDLVIEVSLNSALSKTDSAPGNGIIGRALDDHLLRAGAWVLKQLYSRNALSTSAFCSYASALNSVGHHR